MTRPLDLGEVMAALEEAGTEQNRKIYSRHGVTGPCFGVSYANLAELARRIGRDHDLARRLWTTGNHDARELAGKVADPALLTRVEAEQWVRDADNYITTGTVAGLVALAPMARSCSDRWRDRRSEWIAAAGWAIVAATAEDPARWTVSDLRDLLGQIEREIHERPNRVRHEMTMALIAIALRDGNLRRSVLAASRRIGPISVDHGETSCVTPEVAPYVERTLAHRARRSAVRSR